MLEALLFWIIAFIVTWLDDFLVLVALWLMYPRKFSATVVGTLIWLIIITIPAAFLWQIISGWELPTQEIIALILTWICIRLIREWIKDQKDEPPSKLLNSHNITVAILAMKMYIVNWIDDFVLYTSFYSQHTDLHQIYSFTIGIFLWLFLFVITIFALDLFYWEKLKNLTNSAQGKIKIFVWILLLPLIVYLLIF